MKDEEEQQNDEEKHGKMCNEQRKKPSLSDYNGSTLV